MEALTPQDHVELMDFTELYTQLSNLPLGSAHKYTVPNLTVTVQVSANMLAKIRLLYPTLIANKHGIFKLHVIPTVIMLIWEGDVIKDDNISVCEVELPKYGTCTVITRKGTEKILSVTDLNRNELYHMLSDDEIKIIKEGA